MGDHYTHRPKPVGFHGKTDQPSSAPTRQGPVGSERAPHTMILSEVEKLRLENKRLREENAALHKALRAAGWAHKAWCNILKQRAAKR